MIKFVETFSVVENGSNEDGWTLIENGNAGLQKDLFIGKDRIVSKNTSEEKDLSFYEVCPFHWEVSTNNIFVIIKCRLGLLRRKSPRKISFNWRSFRGFFVVAFAFIVAVLRRWISKESPQPALLFLLCIFNLDDVVLQCMLGKEQVESINTFKRARRINNLICTKCIYIPVCDVWTICSKLKRSSCCCNKFARNISFCLV